MLKGLIGICFFFQLSLMGLAHAQVCQHLFPQNSQQRIASPTTTPDRPITSAGTYLDLLDFSPLPRKNTELSSTQRAQLLALITRMDEMAFVFRDRFNDMLAPLGQDPLPELRELFTLEAEAMQRSHDMIKAALKRYLSSEQEMSFGSLRIHRLLMDRRDDGWGQHFLDHPEQVYFDLNFFIERQNPNGSTQIGHLHTPQSSPNNLAQSVRIHRPGHASNQPLFPGTDIPVPSDWHQAENSFAGIPMTETWMNFLEDYGQRGYLQIGFIPEYSQTARPFPLRWLGPLQQRIPLLRGYPENITEETAQRADVELADLSHYIFHQSRLYLPTLAVSLVRRHEGLGALFNMRRPQYEHDYDPASSLHLADAMLPPSSKHLLIAVLELAYTHHLPPTNWDHPPNQLVRQWVLENQLNGNDGNE